MTLGLSKKFSTEKQGLQPGYVCKCPGYSASVRIPVCSCQAKVLQPSPLLQVLFKRLVRDEGHNAASATDLNSFCKNILAHSRWIVTGTPTVNLLGLNLGADGEDAASKNPHPSSTLPHSSAGSDLLAALELSSLRLSPGNGNDSELDSPPVPDLGESLHDLFDSLEDEDLGYPARIWSSEERTDLKSLGAMLGGFLMIERFSSIGDFGKLVVDPLFPQAHFVEGGKKSKYIPLPGAIQVLHQVLQMYMVRHLVKDIEAEHPLPPVSQETVLLELHSFPAMTYNIIQAVIAINAVDSAMTDRVSHLIFSLLLCNLLTSIIIRIICFIPM